MNITAASGECKPNKVAEHLEKNFDVQFSDSESEYETPNVGYLFKMAEDVAKELPGNDLVVAEIIFHESLDVEGFRPSHASINVGNVDPAGVEQRKAARRAAEEAANTTTEGTGASND